MYPKSMFLAKIRKLINFLSFFFIFSAVKNRCILPGRVFVMRECRDRLEGAGFRLHRERIRVCVLL